MGWSDWEDLDGEIQGHPAVVIAGETFDVYARGMDDALWQQWWTPDDGWSGWNRLDGDFVLRSSPTVIANGADHRLVFAVGEDGGLWTRNWLASRGWSPTWHRIAFKGITTEAPGVAIAGEWTSIYCRGGGRRDQLMCAAFKGRNPSIQSGMEWFSDDDVRLGSRPSAISFGPDHRDVSPGRPARIWPCP